jgi:RNA polymerase sigma-70 factor (ECF subfamily)
VTSDVFERAVRYRSTYRRSDGEAIQWLVGIARNAIADHVKRSGRSLDTAHQVWWEDDRASAVADRVDLQRALRVLDERERELVSLRFGADLTARQIGELLYMRTNAVEVALHRTLGKLRRELGAPGEPRRAIGEADTAHP